MEMKVRTSHTGGRAWARFEKAGYREDRLGRVWNAGQGSQDHSGGRGEGLGLSGQRVHAF